MMSPPTVPVPASGMVLDPRGKNADPKKLVESGPKSPAVTEYDTSKAKLMRKARKDTATQMRSTEGSVQSSLDLERHPPKEVHWIRDLLSKDIPRSRILAFSYQEPDSDKKPFTWAEYVDRMAKGLLSHIQQARTDPSGNRVPIVFIGYGFGGVIIQRAVELVLTGKAPMAGERPTAAELADETKHVVPEKTSSTANDTAETKDKAAIRTHDIYQILLLDTPFPNEDPLFPANSNVRMCSIMEDIDDGEKDSGIVNDVWKGFATAYSRAPDGKAIDVTWLYSQAKGRQMDGHASEMVNVSTLIRRYTALCILTKSVLSGQARSLRQDQCHSHFNLHCQAPPPCKNPGRAGLHLPRHSVTDPIHTTFPRHIPPKHRCCLRHPRVPESQDHQRPRRKFDTTSRSRSDGPPSGRNSHAVGQPNAGRHLEA